MTDKPSEKPSILDTSMKIEDEKDVDELGKSSKPANPFNNVGLATDRKVNIHH